MNQNTLFYGSRMKKKTFAYLILLIGFVLLGVNCFDLFFNKPEQTNLSGLISNVLLIVLMLVNIRDLNKNEKRQE